MTKINFWKNKKVLITGHTGFKGSWLSLWLLNLGAKIQGISLAPNTSPSLFQQLNLKDYFDHQITDIRDYDTLKNKILNFNPDVIFHLAAQPLVGESYQNPIDTWSTNVMGTINLLNSLRSLSNICSAIFITSDKCYENHEWVHGYRETDRLGGHDPYSSSKAGAELAIASWRKSFFTSLPNIGIASVRAGNVIGGGDWTAGRILPDIVTALSKDEPIRVRHPHSTRPWQHVLEPLGGYLVLAEQIYSSIDSSNLSTKDLLCTPFNFGPFSDSNCSVKTLVESCLNHWPGSWLDCSSSANPHEAQFLNLSIDKAIHTLGWLPKWNFHKTVEASISWYRDAYQLGLETNNLQDITLHQIREYENL